MRLEPCPFCGSIPKINTNDRNSNPHQVYDGILVEQRVLIECKECFCKKDILVFETVSNDATEKECRALQKEMARKTIEFFWNRRVWT